MLRGILGKKFVNCLKQKGLRRVHRLIAICGAGKIKVKGVSLWVS